MGPLVARRIVVIITGIFLIGVVAGPAAAAGETTIQLEPSGGVSDGSAAVNQNLTVLVTVSDADAGVGSYDITVSVSDLDTVRIIDIVPRDEPTSIATRVRSTSATLSAIGADTQNGSSVIIAEVILRTESSGTADVSLTVDAMGDEAGQAYTVTDTTGTTIAVSEEEMTPGDERTANPGEPVPNLTVGLGFVVVAALCVFLVVLGWQRIKR